MSFNACIYQSAPTSPPLPIGSWWKQNQLMFISSYPILQSHANVMFLCHGMALVSIYLSNGLFCCYFFCQICYNNVQSCALYRIFLIGTWIYMTTLRFYDHGLNIWPRLRARISLFCSFLYFTLLQLICYTSEKRMTFFVQNHI